MRCWHHTLVQIVVLLCIAIERASAVDPANQSVSFENDVRPLLKAKCDRCHGAETQKGELALHTAAGIRKGGEAGAVVVPGNAAKSLLFEMVHKREMPPDKKNPLSDKEVELIRRWIDGGAEMGKEIVPHKHELTQRDVIPILLLRCTACHGRQRQEAGLDLRTREAMLKGGKSGPAFMPGKPDESLLLKRIRAEEMPPRPRLTEVSVKPMEAEELNKLARWIELGAPEAIEEVDVAGTAADPLVRAEDREFWSFQPPRAVTAPNVKHADRVRNAIDAFVLQKLEEKGLSLSPEADRPTLIRRAAFDLTGLPPEPAEVDAFLADQADDAYEKLIDRLLASSRYGERWGRHWLDVAGYADCEGRREQHLPRPFAWRYRDYVIRSFNADKPYDRFLQEQLAGDDLADYEHATKITQEIEDNLVATAFLRMAPDPTWANLTGFVPDRLEVMADVIDVVSSGIMGLTMKCARCHSHKFDPIPQRDYYRLVAIFKGAYDEHDWLKPELISYGGAMSAGFGERYLPHVTTAERTRRQRLLDEINTLKAGPQSPDVEKRIKELEVQRGPEPRIMALWDRGDPSPTYIYRRGDHNIAGSLVSPGPPAVLCRPSNPKRERVRALNGTHIERFDDQPERASVRFDAGLESEPDASAFRLNKAREASALARASGYEARPPFPGAKSTGRRLAFVRWLTQPDHPLTARVMVNRVWKHHFGAGLVRSVGNFGKTGDRPTHPELLDWLAREFVQHGWSLKQLHRTMMTSNTYRQRSLITADHEHHDRDNRLLSRMPMRRMEAEVLRDTLLLVAGQLNETRFGPADAVQVRADGLVLSGKRRSVYVQQLRKHPASLLESFDLPAMNPNCLQRSESLVAPQALHLMNDAGVRELAGQFADRVLRDVGADPTRQIQRIYSIALSRSPIDDEQAACLQSLAVLSDEWLKLSSGGTVSKTEATRRALATVCHTLMNSATFIYID